jgi:hypothetical protein
MLQYKKQFGGKIAFGRKELHNEHFVFGLALFRRAGYVIYV